MIGNALHESGLEKPQNLAVHVVDCCGREEHGADGPANAAYPRASG
jgi:hypothetical protein